MSRDGSPPVLGGQPDFADNAADRHRTGRMWHLVFMASMMVGIVALSALLLNVVNSTFGYVVIVNEVDPTSLQVDGVSLDAMNSEQLITLLGQHEAISKGRRRALDAELPFSERSIQNLRALVTAEIVEPQVEETWSLLDSVFRRAEIMQTIEAEHPDGMVEFRSWLHPAFLTTPQNPEAELAGVRTAILGSLWTILITILVALPLGIGAAIYLEEYADHDIWINRVIQTNINNLAGVPSIIYGMLGLAIFVRALAFFTSGAFLGAGDPDATLNGRTIISAGLTLALLILPLVIIASQEAVRAVPSSLRQASYGLGATHWQTIWHHVLPAAIPGILTGAILAISRAIGETAPIVVIGASTFITKDPSGPFAQFTTLPIQIYQWTARPQGEFRNIAAAAIIVLLILLLTLNATAVFLRNRFQVRY